MSKQYTLGDMGCSLVILTSGKLRFFLLIEYRVFFMCQRDPHYMSPGDRSGNSRLLYWANGRDRRIVDDLGLGRFSSAST